MRFQSAPPNGHYRVIRLLSGEGAWEIGVSLFATGARLRMGRTGHPPSVLDFCLGRDPGDYAPVVCAVLDRLGALPDSATAAEVDAVFPWAGTRPDLAVHLPELLSGGEGGRKITASPPEVRITRQESQTAKAKVTSAFSHKLVSGKIGQP